MSTLHWALIALFFVVIFLHVASAFFKCKIADILAYVNISLHIVAVFLLLLADVSLEAVALCFMSDLLIYILLNLSAMLREKRRENKDDV